MKILKKILPLFFVLLFQQVVFAQISAKHIIDHSESGETLFFENLNDSTIELKINFNTGDRELKFCIAQNHRFKQVTFRSANLPFIPEPIFSYDNKIWFPIEKSWDENEYFYFSHSFQKTVAYISLTQPADYNGPGSAINSKPLSLPYYDLARLEDYISNVSSHPLVQTVVLGQSVQGRNIYLLTISNTAIPDSAKKTVWLQFRVHGNEVAQSYIFEGLVDYLLSADSSDHVANILNKINFKLIPAINPDGIVMNTRRNANNIDLNRIWVDSTNHELEEPEVRCVHDALDDLILNQELKVHFAIDKHGWWRNSDGGYRTFAHVAGEAYVNDQSSFLNFLLRFNPWQRWEDWHFSEGATGMARLALFRQHKLNIMTSETSSDLRFDGSEVSEENLRQEGVAFVEAIFHYLYHVYFTDNKNNEMETYALKDSIFIRLEEYDANQSASSAENCRVILTSTSSDTENVMLIETDINSGIFVNPSGIPINSNSPITNDGNLQVRTGDQIYISYQDIDFPDDFCSDTASIAAESEVSDISNMNIPQGYQLFQNYPNPFNGTTSISFLLQFSGDVKLILFNMNGQKVRTLINGAKSPGFHIVNWDGNNENFQPVSSGIYYYQLVLDTKLKRTKKLLLLK